MQSVFGCNGSAVSAISSTGLWQPIFRTEALAVACCGLPIDPAQGDLDEDGAATLRDEAIFRRMLAGLPILHGSAP